MEINLLYKAWKSLKTEILCTLYNACVFLSDYLPPTPFLAVNIYSDIVGV